MFSWHVFLIWFRHLQQHYFCSLFSRLKRSLKYSFTFIHFWRCFCLMRCKREELEEKLFLILFFLWFCKDNQHYLVVLLFFFRFTRISLFKLVSLGGLEGNGCIHRHLSNLSKIHDIIFFHLILNIFQRWRGWEIDKWLRTFWQQCFQL